MCGANDAKNVVQTGLKRLPKEDVAKDDQEGVYFFKISMRFVPVRLCSAEKLSKIFDFRDIVAFRKLGDERDRENILPEKVKDFRGKVGSKKICCQNEEVKSVPEGRFDQERPALEFFFNF